MTSLDKDQSKEISAGELAVVPTAHFKLNINQDGKFSVQRDPDVVLAHAGVVKLRGPREASA